MRDEGQCDGWVHQGGRVCWFPASVQITQFAQDFIKILETSYSWSPTFQGAMAESLCSS